MARGRRGGIVLKSPREVDLMRVANRHVAEILQLLCDAARPGVSTWALDEIARKEIARRPIQSAFLGYGGYPAVLCTSINEVIVHGIPRRHHVLKDGDIIGIDFGVSYRGYVGDSARTVLIGNVDEKSRRLVEITELALERAIQICTTEHRLSDIGKVVEAVCQDDDFGIVRDFVGHGIGTRMHEDPQVPNYYDGPKLRLRSGMVLAIEPMLNLGTHEVEVLDDGWTARTRDGLRSAHFEDSIAITDNGPEILSRLD